ncbi:MAG TPA: hypothetical protein VIV60_00665 [Polyangiaceae bacterium]
MQKIPFFSLDRSIQDRFVDSTHGKEVPNPLLYRKSPSNPWARLLASLALLTLSGGVVFAWIGFGKLEHRWAIDPKWAMAVYCGVACVALLSLLGAIVIWERDANVPFLRGLFVYPVGVIDASRETIVLHEFTDLAEHALLGNKLRLRFNHGPTYEFSDKDKRRLEQVEATIADSQQRLSQPPESVSHRDLVLLNPLLETGFRNPFGSTKPLVRERVEWHRFWFLIALGVGLPLGFGAYYLRNVLSEKNLYSTARRLDTTAAYRNYLARGGQRSDVKDLLLPRAELRDARTSQSISAVEAYLDSHPNSKIRPEIEAILRVLLLTELEKVRDTNSVSALRTFRDSNKYTKVIQAELEATEKSLFRQALSKYLGTTPTTPEQKTFITHLLEYARLHGPTLEVRFRRQVPADAVERSEVQLKKSAYYAGPSALPSQYFSPKYAEPREASLVAALGDRFGKAFPSDIIKLELGPVLEDDASTPTVTKPTILITHRTELAGVFLTRKPRGAFVGLSVQYKSRMLIPGDPATLDFQSSVWLAPSPRKLEDAGLNYKVLYETMAQDGFSRFQKRFLAQMFGGTP